MIRKDGASCRDWLHLIWTGDRNPVGPFGEWYQICTTLDFELAPLEERDSQLGLRGNLVFATIASNDRLEADLRRLGGLLHYRNTKDREGALSMMAVRPPGGSIMPTWLENRANDASRSVDQRNSRVRRQKGRGAGKGRGRGRGRGEDGADEEF